MLTFLNNLRLSVTQWLLLSAAAVIALLSLLLRFRTVQLRRTQAQLLQLHYSNENQRLSGLVDQAMAKRDKSKERYNNAVKAYNYAKLHRSYSDAQKRNS